MLQQIQKEQIDDSMDFVAQIHRFEMMMHRSKPTHELPPGMFMTLLTIGKMMHIQGTVEGIPVSDLTKELEQTRPAISQKLNILEEKGYIIREQSKTDRRCMMVRVSERGCMVLSDARGQFRKYLVQLNKKMGAEKLQVLTELLKEAVDQMSEVLQEEETC